VQPLGSSQHFMEPEGSLPSSQELSTCTYLEPNQSSLPNPANLSKLPQNREPIIILPLYILALLTVVGESRYQKKKEQTNKQTNKKKLCGPWSASKLYRLIDRHLSTKFSTNFCGYRGVVWSAQRIPYGR
jgi:hypothetical protein